MPSAHQDSSIHRVSSNLSPNHHTALVGRAAELLVASIAASEGLEVWQPLTQYTKADLLLVCQGKPIRVQVKQALYIPPRRRKAGWGDRAEWRADLERKYQRGDFDILAVVCQVGEVYFIPEGALLVGQGLGRFVRIKPDPGNLTRADARAAADRWQSWRNSLQPALEALRLLGIIDPSA